MTKEKTITKSMKYRIKFNKDLYNILSDIQYDTWKIKNKTISASWDWQQFSFGYKERFGKFPKESEVLEKALSSDIYQQLRHMGENMASSTYNTAIKEALDKFKEQKLRMLRGEESIVSYKRGGSFPIRATQIKDIGRVNSKTYSVKLSLLSTKYVKELKEELKKKNEKLVAEGKDPVEHSFELKTQIPATLMSGNGANEIMDRIISGEYKLCDSRITMDNKNRYYLSIVYSFAPERRDRLNPNRIMGVDVGVTIPAYLAISDDGYYRQAIGNATEVRRFQGRVSKRKRELQQSRKWAGDGSVGHGVKTRLKPLDILSGKIARYKEQKNHVWSREIINEAIKLDCGKIQMEDLSGIAEDTPFLKTWNYYQLQTMIEYKAKEVGIEVVKIEPKYTSARCNKCGNIHHSKDKEIWRPTQEHFKCMTCDWGHKFKVNADWNAALNIAIKDIKDIIKEQLNTQKEQEKKLATCSV